MPDALPGGRVLLTGAGGFAGRAAAAALQAAGYRVRGAFRASPAALPAGCAEAAVVGEMGPGTEWSAALAGVDAVVHLAARVHQLGDAAPDPLAEHRRVNRDATRRLAEEAAARGVRRLVFVSTVKVNGERTDGTPFREHDPPAPADPYAVSKREAEEALGEVAGRTGLEVVVIRPPLMYGPGVKANFLRLLRAVDRGVPLPLGGVRNRRTLLYVGNLADLLARAVAHPAAAGQTFLAADAEAVSTPELLSAVALALGRPARLLPVPGGWLRAAGRLTGRAAAVERLLGSLEVDGARARATLGWTPPFTLRQGLEETVRWYRATGGRG